MASSAGPPFFVRTATLRDVGAIQALLKASWHAAYDGIHGPDRVASITAEWHSAAALKAQVKRLNAEFVVADDGHRLGGVAFAAAGRDAGIVTLYQLYVHPALQRNGIGSMLLTEIENAFPQARRIRLEVEEANRVAVGFYLRHGFGLQDRGDAASVYEKTIG